VLTADSVREGSVTVILPEPNSTHGAPLLVGSKPGKEVALEQRIRMDADVLGGCALQ
jgi:hypothetical protein